MKVILHPGAHKTASSYLQRRMETHAGHLAAHGVLYAGPARLRDRSLPRRAGQPDWVSLLREARQTGAKRLLISEENLLGGMARCVQRFYEAPRKRLRPLVAVVKQMDLTLLIGIRGYAGFYPSVYGHLLRSGTWQPFDEIRSRALKARRGWPDVIGDIMKDLPGDVTLKLWRFEDFETLERRILAEMAGPEAGPGIKSVSFRQLAGPSQAAIDHLAGLAEAGGGFTTEIVLETYQALRKAKGHAPFDPWSGDERAHLEARYRRDIDEIARRWPGALIDPGAT